MDELTRLTTALAERYQIEREIGAGGMATVFLARDVRHDRPVALKVLEPELGAVLTDNAICRTALLGLPGNVGLNRQQNRQQNR